MKKRFLVLAMVFCFGGLLISCKAKEVKKEEEPKVTVTQKEVKENKEKENDKQDENKDENKDEKGLNFSVIDLKNNEVKTVVKKNDKISFNIYAVGMDFKIKLDGKEYSVADAISNGLLDENKLFDKIEKDKESNKCKSKMYKDGGTLEYLYNDYTIIKFNSLDGKEDMYITREKSLSDLKKVIETKSE